MKKWLYQIARALTRWAWQPEIQAADGLAEIIEMHGKPGSMQMTVKQHPAVSEYVAHAFAGLVASSPNYTEMKFEVRNPDNRNGWEFITVCATKGKGMTPHQLRRAAEIERDTARRHLRDLVNRCDGPEGVLADGSNMDTSGAHAFLGDFKGRS